MAWRRAVRCSILAVVVVTGLSLGVGVSPASALSCAGGGWSMQESVEHAVANDGTIFVGTVVSTTNDGTWATFAVDEVWAGDVPDEVEVKADSRHKGDLSGIAGYDPPEFEPGVRYLVMPSEVRPGVSDSYYGSEEGEYEIGPCSTPPPPFGDGLLQNYRPASARIVERDQSAEIVGAVPMATDDGPPWLVVGGAVVVFVVVSGALVLRWRRSHVPIDVDAGASSP